ncbi:MAG: (d)CMP kinase [Candidatus Nanohaloarchaea archaeon]
MGSYVDEFEDDHEKESDLIIVVGGPSKSGKSTLASHIADKLDINHVSAGDIFREIAADRSMTVEELSREADKETDIEVDRRVLEIALSESCAIDSRIAAWVLGDHVDFSIYLTADLEERASRLAEVEDISQEKAEKLVEERDQDNHRRYSDYYGIDTHETDLFDVIVDNTDLNIEEQNQVVGELLEQRFPSRTADNQTGRPGDTE